MAKVRFVFLNGMPINAIQYPRFGLTVTRASLHELRHTLQLIAASMNATEVEYFHAIRHASTLALLRKYIHELDPQPNSGLYQYREGDVIVVVTLKTPQRGQEVTELREEDLDIAVVTVNVT